VLSAGPPSAEPALGEAAPLEATEAPPAAVEGEAPPAAADGVEPPAGG
jgi:hypothetical protein